MKIVRKLRRRDIGKIAHSGMQMRLARCVDKRPVAGLPGGRGTCSAPRAAVRVAAYIHIRPRTSADTGPRPLARPGLCSAPGVGSEAAGGPLVGDPELIAGEQSCQQSHPNPPWFTTIAAFEVYDSARTHLYGCAHFLGSTTPSNANRVLAYQSTDVFPTPYNIVTEGPNSMFIYGGGYGDNPAASGSFVASVQPQTSGS